MTLSAIESLSEGENSPQEEAGNENLRAPAGHADWAAACRRKRDGNPPLRGKTRYPVSFTASFTTNPATA